jgi:hypothetical protein
MNTEAEVRHLCRSADADLHLMIKFYDLNTTLLDAFEALFDSLLFALVQPP